MEEGLRGSISVSVTSSASYSEVDSKQENRQVSLLHVETKVTKVLEGEVEGFYQRLCHLICLVFSKLTAKGGGQVVAMQTGQVSQQVKRQNACGGWVTPVSPTSTAQGSPAAWHSSKVWLTRMENIQDEVMA
jgi:hypothetical protein